MAKRCRTNPNAPDHQPCKRAATTVDFAVNKAFSCPNKESKKRLHSQYQRCQDINTEGRKIEQRNLKNPAFQLPLPTFPPFTSSPSAKHSNVGTGRTSNSSICLHHLN